jgi:flagellar hook-associated protein 2
VAISVPTSSASSGTLTASGVGSGLDIKSLVNQLMAVEQRPLGLLAQQEARYQAKLSALGSVQGYLSSIQSVAQTLSAGVSSMYGASVSDPDIVSAALGSNAQSGSYALQVDSLAQVQKLVSPAPGSASSASAIGAAVSSSVTITLGSISGTAVDGQYASAGFSPAGQPVSLTIDSSNNTLAGIRDAINAAGAGISATIINDGGATPYRLALTSGTTGTASSMRIAVSGDASIEALLAYDPTAPAQNLDQVQAAQDARLSIDGVAITRPTNAVSNAIEGVTLSLLKTSEEPVTLDVQFDKGKLNSALGSLVSAYNGANKAIAAASAKGAVLQGDSVVLGLQRRLRAIVSDAQRGLGGGLSSLSQLGISFQKDGSLALDSAKLSAALASHSGDALALAAKVGDSLKSALDTMLGAQGAIANSSSGIDRSIRDIGERRVQIQNRLVNVQARYQAQFNALDRLLSGMGQTSAFLTQQLASLPRSN